MIIKVERGNSADGLLIYQRRLDRTPEEQAGVRLFALHGIRNVESVAAVLDRAAMRSGRKNPIVHIIIRAERALSDDEWRIAMMAALEEAGLAGNAFAAFRHDNDDDDPGDHMHIAAVAADRDGNTPPRFFRSQSLDRRVNPEEKEQLPRGDVQSRAWDSQLRRRLMATARRLEDDLGLRPLARNRAALSEPVRIAAKVSQGAHAREKRTGTPSLANLLNVQATQAALYMPDYDERAAALARLDLKLQPFFRKNGDLAGLRLYRISDHRLHCPASTLGSDFSLKALDRRSPISFADWYSDDTSSTPTVPEQAANKADPLRTRYAEYTREVAARRDRLREERLAIIGWRRRERAKALARRKMAVPATRTRSARVHRAAVMASYKLACAEIDAEARRQHDTIDSHRVQRLDFVDWLESQAPTDPAAARKLATLRERGTAAPPSPTIATSAAPRPASSPLSSGEQAAAVAAQERLMRAADQLEEDKAVLRQRDAIEALANRLDEIGIKLIVDADRQNRRVRTTADGVIIDGVRMMPVPHRLEQLLAFTQAKITENAQLNEERDLAIVIRSAHGVARRPGETPAVWLGRLYGGRDMARWLTTEQEAAIRTDWAVSDEAELRRHAPSDPALGPDTAIDRPAALLTPTSSKMIQPPSANASLAEPPPTRSISINAVTAVTPVKLATSQYGHVREAIAMMKTQRSGAALNPPSQDVSVHVEPDTPAAISVQTPGMISHVHQAAGSTASPQPNKGEATAVPSQGNSEPAALTPVPAPNPAPASALRPAGPVEASNADLIARWLVIAEAAKADPSRQRESEALAAQLIMHDGLGILGGEIQAQVSREADNHRRRLAEGARDATMSQAVQPAATAAPSPPIAEPMKVTPVDPKRAAALSHIGKINDPWQRS